MKAIELAAAVAVSAVLSSTAYAADAQPFSALAGVEAQALSSSEMGAIYGQVTKAQIKAAVVAKVQDLRLRANLLAQCDRLANNAMQLQALYTLVVRGYY
jgi:hypothetical protein